MGTGEDYEDISYEVPGGYFDNSTVLKIVLIALGIFSFSACATIGIVMVYR